MAKTTNSNNCWTQEVNSFADERNGYLIYKLKLKVKSNISDSNEKLTKYKLFAELDRKILTS
jgi:hypothetical protein